jgi:hypothetical protein
MPRSPSKVNKRFRGIYYLHVQAEEQAKQESSMKAYDKQTCLHACFVLAYYSTRKMEAIRSSETSVDFPNTTRRYIRDDKTLYNHHCEIFKSYIIE